MGCRLWILLILMVFLAGCPGEESTLRIGGGPTGGTFQKVAEGLAGILDGVVPGRPVVVVRTGGSLANLRGVEDGRLDMALVYAGDAYMASMGRLEKNLPPTRNLKAMTRLYGATAHLVVHSSGNLWSPLDLRKKRVAIGNPGSGAALSAERYFRVLGIWAEIIPVHLGYSMATKDLVNGRVEAVWEMVGYPSESVEVLGQHMSTRLLDLQSPALSSGLFESYPFYRPTVIPAGTYSGQAVDIPTFQDAALLVAGAQLEANLVEHALEGLFSREGMSRMRTAHEVARDLHPDRALHGVEIPLHPGAERFLRKRGMFGSSGN